MVEAFSPVSENVVPVRPLAIWLAADGVKPLVVERNTEYVTPLVDDAVQLRLIWVAETGVAVKPVGGAGTPAVQVLLPENTWNSESCAAGQPVLAVKFSRKLVALVPDGKLKLTVLPVAGLKV